jgi:predicted transcriptional regulator
MGPDKNQQFNNVYAGTEFYKTSTSVPTFTGNWIKQLIRIVQDFPQTEFVRIHGATTAEIPQFSTVSNLKSMQLAEFLNHLAPQTQTVNNG